MTMTKEAARDLANGYILGAEDAQLDEVAAIMVADEVCLWHAAWEYHNRRAHLRPSCKVCGGKTGRLNERGAHYLCEIRKAKGRPTPSLGDEVYPCYCSPCVNARGETPGCMGMTV